MPNEIPAQVADFLEGRISLDQFEDWSAAQSWNIHQRAGEQECGLAYLIEGILIEHSDDLTEDATRKAIRDIFQLTATGKPYEDELPKLGIAQ